MEPWQIEMAERLGIPYVRSGWPALHTGLRPYQREGIEWMRARRSFILADDMGLGKAQPIEEPILTPTGWKPLAVLKVGDYAMSCDGTPTKITGIFYQGIKQAYKIESNDGSYTYACLDHLWEVTTPSRKARGSAPLVLTTAQLLQRGLQERNGNNKFYLPVCKPIQYGGGSQSLLPIAPYTLGVLLGDGACKSGTPTFCKGDEELGYLVQLDLGPSWYVKRTPEEAVPTWRIVRSSSEQLSMAALLKSLKLNCNSLEKHIPEQYLRADEHSRWELLKGLLDTDAYAHDSLIEFSTGAYLLAIGITELVQSLGGVAYTSVRMTASGNPGWRVNISLGKGVAPFKRKEQLARFTPKTKYEPTRPITRITASHMSLCACIKVEHPRQLYITRHHIVTHNTVQILHSLSFDAPVILFCPLGARSVWSREIKRWCPRMHQIVGHAREMRFPKKGELLITNLDKLWRDRLEGGNDRECFQDAVKQIAPHTLLVVDEAHALLKDGKKTKRVKRFRMLARAIRNTGGANIAITGTPILNYKAELYNLLVSFGLEDAVFRDYSEAAGMLRLSDKFADPDPEVKARLRRVMLRRTKEEVFPQMPPKIRELRSVEIPEALSREMDELWEKLQHYRLDTIEEFGHALWAEGGIEVFSLIRAALAVAKIPACLEIASEMEDADEPLVVCSAYLAPVAALAKREGWRKIDGSVSANERGRVEDDFREGRCRGVALTIKAGGVGISLTRARVMVLSDLEWSPGLNDQAEDRLRPHLQNYSCSYIYLVAAHPLEEHLTWLLREKRDVIGKIMG